jgi:hypothetical protein
MKSKEMTNIFFPMPIPSHTTRIKDISREILWSFIFEMMAQQPPPPFGIPNFTLLPPLVDLISIAILSTHSIRRSCIPIPGDDSTESGTRTIIGLPEILLGETDNAWTRCFR